MIPKQGELLCTRKWAPCIALMVCPSPHQCLQVSLVMLPPGRHVSSDAVSLEKDIVIKAIDRASSSRDMRFRQLERTNSTGYLSLCIYYQSLSISLYLAPTDHDSHLFKSVSAIITTVFMNLQLPHQSKRNYRVCLL